MKILLAVDGSEYTQRMLSYLTTHDELLGPGHRYTALNVVTPVPSLAANFLAHDTVQGYYDEQAENALKPVREFAANKGWQLEYRHVAGHAADVICEFAETGKFDLLVMGTHGHSALGSMVLGSTTSRVIAQSKLPVLLVR
jgi:nucleotide-binding universal stress UspA family protein